MKSKYKYNKETGHFTCQHRGCDLAIDGVYHRCINQYCLYGLQPNIKSLKEMMMWAVTHLQYPNKTIAELAKRIVKHEIKITII